MRHHKRRATGPALLVATLVTLAPITQAAASSGVQFSHNDWTIACDNTRTCRAAGYQPDGSERAVSLLLTRKAGPGTRVEARVRLGQTVEWIDIEALSLEIHGEDLGALDLDRDEGIATLHPDQVDAVLVGLTGISRITFVGSNPDDRWELSDSGANAVLLKMDEFQGRLDTPGALIQRGNGNEAHVLPPLPVPVLRIAASVATRAEDIHLAESEELRDALIQSLGDAECVGALPGDAGDVLDVERLSDTKLLVSTRCWRAAYNWGYGFWVVDDTAPFQSRLVTVDGGHYENGVIEAIQNGSGIGDCVWSARWIWDGTGFIPAHEADTGLCRKVALGGAWEMPTLVNVVVR